MNKTSIFWFRRDLRLHDNKALFFALDESDQVMPIFIFDTDITDHLPPDDARVEFIYNSLKEINDELAKSNKSIRVFKGKPVEIFRKLVKENNISSVYTNKDHEPYGIQRDQIIASFLKKNNIAFYPFLDHLLFDKNEILKDDDTPYSVFTPYKNRAVKTLNHQHLFEYKSEQMIHKFMDAGKEKYPKLDSLGFKRSHVYFPDKEGTDKIINKYDETRDYPHLKGTTRLGIHLRFGTVSLRKLTHYAQQKNETFFNELIWREFYAMILRQHPHIVDKSFKPKYDNIEWRNNREEFEKWKAGKTGYPIVDAGMRQLSKTGYMHNRVRMITASFLTKHLLIDWRWGEAWFAEKLLDYELSSNNGGWQWAAGSGCDAAPYFRIFNPYEQRKKFDPQYKYVKEWVPELNSDDYPSAMVEHKFARQRCLDTYKVAL